jgi:hypothetical protein
VIVITLTRKTDALCPGEYLYEINKLLREQKALGLLSWKREVYAGTAQTRRLVCGYKMLSAETIFVPKSIKSAANWQLMIFNASIAA